MGNGFIKRNLIFVFSKSIQLGSGPPSLVLVISGLISYGPLNLNSTGVIE